MNNMDKKVYVITGATSGIGNALVKAFAVDGMVFAGYRNSKYVEDLKAISPNVVPFYIDMEKPDSIRSAASYIKFQVDKIDTLINVAGCVVAGAMERLDISELKKQFQVNTFSHIEFTQQLLCKLELAKEAKVINISSMSSFGIFPFIAPYCASKRALDILANSMMLEMKNDVKVVSVKPGVIATPLWGKSIENNQTSIQNCQNYEKEMKFLTCNAHKNEVCGLSVDKVVSLIKKIDKNKNPKPSYTIGKDAKFAEIFSKLPLCFVNKFVSLGLKLRVK